MRALTDDLFEYAKASDEQHPLEMEPVCLFSAVADVLAGMYPQFAERGWAPDLRFEDEDARVLAAAEALARVIGNVLSNALRYGLASPRIEQRGSTLTVSNEVSDPDAIDAARLFGRFYRADASRAGKGTGLGIAIVACLCERMGASAAARVERDVLFIDLRFKSA